MGSTMSFASPVTLAKSVFNVLLLTKTRHSSYHFAITKSTPSMSRKTEGIEVLFPEVTLTEYVPKNIKYIHLGRCGLKQFSPFLTIVNHLTKFSRSCQVFIHILIV